MSCPICLENSQELCSKFNCDHETCSECFKRQISSRSNLCCSICRASIQQHKLNDDEKNLLRERQEQRVTENSNQNELFGLFFDIMFNRVPRDIETGTIEDGSGDIYEIINRENNSENNVIRNDRVSRMYISYVPNR